MPTVTLEFSYKPAVLFKIHLHMFVRDIAVSTVSCFFADIDFQSFPHTRKGLLVFVSESAQCSCIKACE